MHRVAEMVNSRALLTVAQPPHILTISAIYAEVSCEYSFIYPLDSASRLPHIYGIL